MWYATNLMYNNNQTKYKKRSSIVVLMGVVIIWVFSVTYVLMVSLRPKPNNPKCSNTIPDFVMVPVHQHLGYNNIDLIAPGYALWVITKASLILQLTSFKVVGKNCFFYLKYDMMA